MKTYLYRYWDENSVLLYVGISSNAIRRLTEHKSTAGWFDVARSVTIAQFDTREGAMAAEAAAIRDEKPLHNKSNAPDRPKHRPVLEDTREGHVSQKELLRRTGMNKVQLWRMIKRGEYLPPQTRDRQNWWNKEWIEAYELGEIGYNDISWSDTTDEKGRLIGTNFQYGFHDYDSGHSSEVERDLAKVDVEGSNPSARSNI